ncbi:MAG: lysophospholipid acyltransferase family protein [Cytophagaceae bacterium]|nr:lysophospholipid acyltransferase family protein [Cytophagaceae bacterium]
MNKKKLMQAIGFYSVYPLLWLLGWFPLWMLYRISDFLFLIVAAFGYRRKVITDNLHRAFPHKSNREICRIRVKFYRHLCDTMMETVCMSHINPKKIMRRIEFVNYALVNESTQSGKDVIVAVGHYGCWEWMSSISNLFIAEGYSVYRPLKNVHFDKYMIRLRSIFKCRVFPMKNTVREIVKLKRENRRFVLGLIADQSPSVYELQYWTTFLTQDTPIITGPEKMARLVNADFYFWGMEKTGRGRYRMTVTPYPADIATAKEYDPTEWQVKMLEQEIINAPEYWLWSHRRWKYQHLKNNR